MDFLIGRTVKNVIYASETEILLVLDDEQRVSFAIHDAIPPQLCVGSFRPKPIRCSGSGRS